MFLKSQLTWNIVIPAENLNPEASMLQRAILVALMNEFASKKSSKDLGYFLAITTLDSIGQGMIRDYSADIIFPVSFSCITFKMLPGEVLEGTVHNISNLGVFLRCGPTDKIYLSHTKMAGYHYVPGDKPYYKNDKSWKIVEDMVLRFVVVAVSHLEVENDIKALVSMEGDYLGPVKLLNA